MAKWVIDKKEANIKLMSETLQISEITSQVLVNRNIRTKNTALKFLNPEFEFFHDFHLMCGVTSALNLLKQYILENKTICIYGDYDVDGVMSSTILYKSVTSVGGKAFYYIPDREKEGYGLNIGAIQKIFDKGADLLLTCDNGIASIKEIEFAKSLNMKVIVIDHHEPGFELIDDVRVDKVPPADFVIDPKQQACTYPFDKMCAAGLSYKFAVSLFKIMEKECVIHDEIIVLASIATFCDVVDLQSENRIIVTNGLKIINENKQINKGLYELMKAKSIVDKEITSFHAGFVIGPCINAAGRLERATIAVELFISEDTEEAIELAKTVARLNDERKELTLFAVDKAIDNLIASTNKGDKVIVVYEPDIHESIAGIVAGRIKENLFHPVIVLTKGDGVAKGSARSIEGYNIFEALYENKHLFKRFGGHAMAAGLTLEIENIEQLRKNLNETCTLTVKDFTETIHIDCELEIENATYKLAEELQKLSPFGKDNHEPLFLSEKVKVMELRVIENKDTIIFTFQVGDSYRKIKAICFGKLAYFTEMLEEIFDESQSDKILQGVLRNIDLVLDIVYYMDINEYNGNVSVQLKLKDFRISQ